MAMLKKQIEAILSPWNLATIQMSLQIQRRLDKMGISWDDVAKYIEAEKEKRQSHLDVKTFLFSGVTCPSCKGFMQLYVVNTQPNNMIGGDHKSQWYCSKCDVSIFQLNSAREEIERVSKRGEVLPKESAYSKIIHTTQRKHKRRKH